jgi:hypothetical protein
LHYYFSVQANWAGKLGGVTGEALAWLSAIIVAILAPYTPVNVAIYIQESDALPEGLHRVVRGIVSVAMFAWMPCIYMWIWWIDRTGEIPWLAKSWNVIFNK